MCCKCCLVLNVVVKKMVENGRFGDLFGVLMWEMLIIGNDILEN